VAAVPRVTRLPLDSAVSHPQRTQPQHSTRSTPRTVSFASSSTVTYRCMFAASYPSSVTVGGGTAPRRRVASAAFMRRPMYSAAPSTMKRTRVPGGSAARMAVTASSITSVPCATRASTYVSPAARGRKTGAGGGAGASSSSSLLSTARSNSCSGSSNSNRSNSNRSTGGHDRYRRVQTPGTSRTAPVSPAAPWCTHGDERTLPPHGSKGLQGANSVREPRAQPGRVHLAPSPKDRILRRGRHARGAHTPT